MPVNPTDFIISARESLSQGREASYRSCISRAYYALYHAALEKSIIGGYTRNAAQSAHRQLVEHIATKDLNLSSKIYFKHIRAINKKRVIHSHF